MTIQELGKRFKGYFGFNPPIDMLMTYAKGPTNARIDLLKLDEEIQRRNPEYNGEECTYKGKPNYSMALAIEEIYGKEAAEFVKNNK